MRIGQSWSAGVIRLAIIAAISSNAVHVAAATLTVGSLVVGESRSPVRISVVNPQTRVKTLICNCTIFNTLKAVAVKGTERIYAIGQIAGGVSYGVVAIDPGSGAQTVVSSGRNITDPSGIAVERDGSILVMNYSPSAATNMVIRVNPTTGAQTIVTSGGRMVGSGGLAVGPTGDIYVAGSISGFARGVLPDNLTIASGVTRVHPVTGEQTVVAYGDDWKMGIDSRKMISASDLTLDQTGIIYVLDKRYRGATLEDETRLIKIDRMGAQTMLTNSFKGIDRSRSFNYIDFRGIAISDGVVYAPDYRTSGTGLAGISTVSASGGARVDFVSDDYSFPTGLALVTSAPIGSSADCFFNWAERNYPTYFAPQGQSTQTLGPYTYRYYPGSRNYLALSTDSHVYGYGPNFGNSLYDIGPSASYIAAAGCSP